MVLGLLDEHLVRNKSEAWISYLAVVSVRFHEIDEVRGTQRACKGSKERPCLTQEARAA